MVSLADDATVTSVAAHTGHVFVLKMLSTGIPDTKISTRPTPLSTMTVSFTLDNTLGVGLVGGTVTML